MKCVTPMVRYYQEYTLDEKIEMKKQGIKQFNRIMPRSTVLDNLEKDEDFYTHIQKKNEKLIKEGSRYRWGLTPCKKCWACRLNYSAEWATRIMNEVKYNENNFFITLTYRPEDVPIFDKINYKDKDGVIQTIQNDGSFRYSLCPDDMHRFINSLRKYYERRGHKGIKYYLCGEYGENGRPHYHLILMNCPLDVEQFYDWHRDENFKMHWKSKEIERIWGKGIIDVAFVEWADAAYVARYGTKLFLNNGSEEDYAKLGMVREFTRCSRNPAIGLHFCEDNEYDLLYTNKIIMKNNSGNTVYVPLPAYYMKKLEEKYPEVIEQIKEDRLTQALRAEKLIKQANNISDKERKEREAQEIARRTGLLKRCNIDIPWNERIPKTK